MFNALNRTRKRAELSRNAMSEIQNVQQSEIQNVRKPKPSDMCHAIRQAVETMESYLPNSEIKEMIVCDKCTLTTEYRPQLTADLERLYNSLDAHDKGVLQDRLDDMWIMYCIARYTDKGACSGQQRGL